MKKLIFFLSFILVTGLLSAQTQILKKNFTLLKGTPTLSLQGAGAIINWNSGDILWTLSSNKIAMTGGVFDFSVLPTVAGSALSALYTSGNISISTNSLLLTGSIGATGARATKIWATDIESTNAPTVGGTSIFTAPVFATSVTFPSGDTTVAAAYGKVIFKTSDSTLYVCKSIKPSGKKKWYKLDN